MWGPGRFSSMRTIVSDRDFLGQVGARATISVFWVSGVIARPGINSSPTGRLQLRGKFFCEVQDAVLALNRVVMGTVSQSCKTPFGGSNEVLSMILSKSGTDYSEFAANLGLSSTKLRLAYG